MALPGRLPLAHLLRRSFATDIGGDLVGIECLKCNCSDSRENKSGHKDIEHRLSPTALSCFSLV